MKINNLPDYAFDCDIVIYHDLGEEGNWFYGGYSKEHAPDVMNLLYSWGDHGIAWCHGWEAERA